MYHNQLTDFAQLLGPTYAHVGVGRDDGSKAGEYSCIFYDRTKFEEIKWKTIWLSPTPDVPGSKGWDAVGFFPPFVEHPSSLRQKCLLPTDPRAGLRSDRDVLESEDESDGGGTLRHQHALRPSRLPSESGEQPDDPRTCL